jgi:hypothetical protein
LVVLDDSACVTHISSKPDGSLDLGLHGLRIGGKGTLIAQVAKAHQG